MDAEADAAAPGPSAADATPAVLVVSGMPVETVPAATPPAEPTGDATSGRRRGSRRDFSALGIVSKPRPRSTKQRDRKPAADDAENDVGPAEDSSEANDWHCAVCNQLASPAQKASLEEPGAVEAVDDLLLACDGGCMRSFHTSCLSIAPEELAAIIAAPPDAPWTCGDCSSGRHACALCGSADAAEYAPVIRWGVVDSVSDAEWLIRHSTWLAAAARSGAAAQRKAAAGRHGEAGPATSAAADPAATALAVGQALGLALAALPPPPADPHPCADADAAAGDGDAPPLPDPRLQSDLCRALCAVCDAGLVSAALASGCDPVHPSSAAADTPRVGVAVGPAALADGGGAVADALGSAAHFPGHAEPSPGPATGKRRRSAGASASATGAAASTGDEVPANGPELAGALAESFVRQALSALPLAASHASPATAGAPASLVGSPWAGSAPRKCVDWRCGRFFHWACLRRMADSAVMDLDVRMHEAAARQRAMIRLHAESLMESLRAAVDAKVTEASAAADSAAALLSKLASSPAAAASGGAAPALRRSVKKKKADFPLTSDAFDVAVEPSSAFPPVPVIDPSALSTATAAGAARPDEMALAFPLASSLEQPEPASASVAHLPDSEPLPQPDASSQSVTPAAVPAVRVRRRSHAGGDGSRPGGLATGGLDPAQRIAAAQIAAADAARRAALARDVARILRGEAIAPRADVGGPESCPTGASKAMVDDGDEGDDSELASPAAPEAATRSLRRQHLTPASGSAAGQTKRSARRRVSTTAASAAPPLIETLLQPWMSPPPLPPAPVYVSCRDLLPRALRRGGDAPAPADAGITPAMAALEAFAKADVPGVRRLLARIGVNPPASWRPPHAAPAPPPGTRRSGGGRDATAGPLPLPPCLRPFALSAAEADSASMEAVWFAPGSAPDFICPTHCCDVCEGGVGGVGASVFGVGALDAVNAAVPPLKLVLPARLRIEFSEAGLDAGPRQASAVLRLPGVPAEVSLDPAAKKSRVSKGWVVELVPVIEAANGGSGSGSPMKRKGRGRPAAGSSAMAQPDAADSAPAPDAPPLVKSAVRSTPASSSQHSRVPLALFIYDRGALTAVRSAAPVVVPPLAAASAARVAQPDDSAENAGPLSEATSSDAPAAPAEVSAADGVLVALAHGVATASASAADAPRGISTLSMLDELVSGHGGADGGVTPAVAELPVSAAAAAAADRSAVARPPSRGDAESHGRWDESVCGHAEADAVERGGDDPAAVTEVSHAAAAGDAAEESDARASDSGSPEGGKIGKRRAPPRSRPGSARRRRASSGKRPQSRRVEDGDDTAPEAEAGGDSDDGGSAEGDGYIEGVAPPAPPKDTPCVALARAWQQREPAAGAPRLLVIEPARVPLVRRLLTGGRHAGRLSIRCMMCPRAYHTACAPPDIACNDYAALCAAHAALRLPGDAEDDGAGIRDAAAAPGGEDAGSEDGGDANADAAAETEVSNVPRSRRRKGGSAPAPAPAPTVDRAAAAAATLRWSRSATAKLRPLALPPTAPPTSSRADWRHFRLPAALLEEAASKPPPYVHIVKNIYTIRVKPRWPDSEPCGCAGGGRGGAAGGGGSSSMSRSQPGVASSAATSSARALHCGEGCVNRLLRIECSGGAGHGAGDADAAAPADVSAAAASIVGSGRVNCSIGPRCGNRRLQDRASPPLMLAPTPGKGWGVLAGADVPAGTFVIEYVGEIVDEETQARRLESAAERGESHAYIMEIDANQYIDARFKSNLARFLNHSCAPNCELQRWCVDGLTRIGIFTIEDVRRGEELCYDYQFFTAATTRCGCGAPKCRGYLGANVARDIAEAEAESGKGSRAGRK